MVDIPAGLTEHVLKWFFEWAMYHLTEFSPSNFDPRWAVLIYYEVTSQSLSCFERSKKILIDPRECMALCNRNTNFLTPITHNWLSSFQSNSWQRPSLEYFSTQSFLKCYEWMKKEGHKQKSFASLQHSPCCPNISAKLGIHRN